MYPNVRKAWDDNYKLAKRNPDKLFGDLDEFLAKTKKKYFRIHVAGDFFS